MCKHFRSTIYGVINCLKALIKGNENYTDLNQNHKPKIRIKSSIFENIDQIRLMSENPNQGFIMKYC